MEPEKTKEVSEETYILLQNLVKQFPMGCVCFRPMVNTTGHADNFSVMCINEKLEEDFHLEPHSVAGKTVAEAFGAVSDLCVENLIEIMEKFEAQGETAVKANVIAYGHIYKVSSIVIFGTFILCFTEDIHSQYFRQHFQRAIPSEIIMAAMAGRNDGSRDQAASGEADTGCRRTDCPADTDSGRKPIRRLPTAVFAEDLQDAAFRDALTGLYNRRFAMELLRMYVDQQVAPLSVALGDINGLRTINETLGFRVGDDILIRVADVLRSNCRMDDTIARWNDGEFIMLLPNTTQADTQCIIRRLREKLCTVCGEDYEDIITFGYTTSGPQIQTADELLWEAEKWVFRKSF